MLQATLNELIEFHAFALAMGMDSRGWYSSWAHIKAGIPLSMWIRLHDLAYARALQQAAGGAV